MHHFSDTLLTKENIDILGINNNIIIFSVKNNGKLSYYRGNISTKTFQFIATQEEQCMTADVNSLYFCKLQNTSDGYLRIYRCNYAGSGVELLTKIPAPSQRITNLTVSGGKLYAHFEE